MMRNETKSKEMRLLIKAYSLSGIQAIIFDWVRGRLFRGDGSFMCEF